MTEEEKNHPFIIDRTRIESQDNKAEYSDLIESSWALFQVDDFKENGWSKKTTVKRLPKKFWPEGETYGYEVIRKGVFKTADGKVITIERFEGYDDILNQLVTLSGCTKEEAELVFAIFERNLVNPAYHHLAKVYDTEAV